MEKMIEKANSNLISKKSTFQLFYFVFAIMTTFVIAEDLLFLGGNKSVELTTQLGVTGKMKTTSYYQDYQESTGDDRRPLYLMGFASINIGETGWSSGGCVPAIEMAVYDVNNRPDILPGYKLHLQMKDSQCDPGVAIKALHDHIVTSPTKLMIIGGGCSIATSPVARAAPHFGLVQMGYSATSPELSDRKLYPNFYRTGGSDLAMVAPIIALIKVFDWKVVATIHQTDPLFATTISRIHSEFKLNNITLLTGEIFTLNAESSMRNLKQKDARIIIMNAYEGEARDIFCLAYKLGMYGKKYLWIFNGWYSQNWMSIDSTDCTIEQVKASAQYALTANSLLNDMSNQVGISGQTFEEYENRYLSWPTFQQYGFNDYHTAGYDAIWAVALALNTSIDILATQNITKNNITRPKRLDDFEYIKEAGMSELFLDQLSKTRFYGVSGFVSFEKGDRRPISEVGQVVDGRIGIIAFHVNETNNMTFLPGKEILWPGDGPPIDAPILEINMKYTNEILVVAAGVVAASGALCAVICIIFNVTYRNATFIKLSSPNLNNVIATGCLLAYLAIIVFGLDGFFIPEEALQYICMVKAVFISTSFSLAFGAMFAKTWRVHVIFTQTTIGKKSHVGDTYLILGVFGLVLVDALILVIWFIIDPFIIIKRDVGTPVETDELVTLTKEFYCSCNHTFTWLGCLYGIKGLLLVFGVFLAYETRQITIPGLNDSKLIGICVYNTVVMCAVGVTVSMAVKGSATVTYAFQVVCVLFCATVTLVLIFIPKMKHIYKYGATGPGGQQTASITFSYSLKSTTKQMSASNQSIDNDNFTNAVTGITGIDQTQVEV